MSASTAIYVRVSTDDQSVESQLHDLRQVCASRGWAGNVVIYRDVITGKTSSREALDRMMADVRRGRVARVVCWKLDRLGRSLSHLAQMVGEFDAARVALVVPSQGIDTSAESPSARFQLNILAAVSEFERSLISDRTKAGLARAAAEGRKGGRPTGSAKPNPKRAAAAALFADQPKITVKDLALAVGVSVGTAHAWRKEFLSNP